MTFNQRQVLSYVLFPLYRNLKAKYFRDNTVELRAVSFELDPTEEYLDYGETRKASRKYIKAEHDWYMSEDLCIKGHELVEDNPIWQHCAARLGHVNSNYGYLAFSDGNHKQFDSAKAALKWNECSRQGIMIYNRPEMHMHYCDLYHANHDFTCTMYTHFFIENDNTLTMIVNMRSNDAIFGLQNDYSWQRYVYMRMLKELSIQERYKDLKIGKMIWQANSMHIYDKHYDLLERIIGEQK